MNVGVSEAETGRMCRTRQQAVCLRIVVPGNVLGFFFLVYPTLLYVASFSALSISKLVVLDNHNIQLKYDRAVLTSSCQSMPLG